MILRHDVEGILYGCAHLNGYRVVNHTVFSTLNNGNLTSLLLDRHILVDNADTALASNGNSHLSLGNSIHSGCYERNLKLNVT